MEITSLESSSAYQQVANSVLQNQTTREVKFGDDNRVPFRLKSLATECPKVYRAAMENIFYSIKHYQDRIKEVMKEQRKRQQ